MRQVSKIRTLIMGCLLLISCKQQAHYHFPDEMKPEVQKQYQVLCERGERLYNLNCAGCHNTGRKKKDVPNFTEAQLVGYTLRVTNARHESALPDSLVSEEDLGLIMYYLKYK